MRSIPSPARLAAVLLLGAFACGPAVPAARAETGDVHVLVVDGTTGEPGRAASVAILPEAENPEPVAEAVGVEGEAVLAGVELDPAATYLLRAVAEGVNYWARETGGHLLQGGATLYVFQVADRPEAARIDDLNLVLRRGESELRLEAMLTVNNTGSPARTVVPRPSSLELGWPPDASATRVTLMSVPDAPTLEPAPGRTAGRIGLPVVLRPGPSRVRVTATMPYAGRAEIPLGSDLAIARWSVLASPPDLQLEAEGLVPEPTEPADEFRRYAGQALPAGAGGLLIVTGGSAPAVTAVSGEPAAGGPAAADTESGGGGGGRSYTWILIVVVGLLALLSFRRRPSR